MYRNLQTSFPDLENGKLRRSLEKMEKSLEFAKLQQVLFKFQSEMFVISQISCKFCLLEFCVYTVHCGY